MGMFDDAVKKAEKLAEDHPEQTEKVSDLAIGKGGALADQVTGDKYTKQIDEIETKADDRI